MEPQTFTAKVKEEIVLSQLNELENRNLFLGYLFSNGTKEKDTLTISLENLGIAQKLFKTIKYCYHLEVKMTIRTQKKFRISRVFIFELKDPDALFSMELSNLDLADDESKKAFMKGVFLAVGSISDPSKRGYHLEMTFDTEEQAQKVQSIANSLDYTFKLLKREKNYMLYLKSSEEISDFIKLLGAVNALFYYEDIRIYRDHKNMVNRLNNCEQANLEKSLKTSDHQIEVIEYILENDYMSLLDEKTRQVAEYRLKYPEESFQSFADILSSELGKPVTKSYVNHHFRKIFDIYDKIIASTGNINENLQ